MKTENEAKKQIALLVEQFKVSLEAREKAIRKFMETYHIYFMKDHDGDHLTLPPKPFYIRGSNLTKVGIVDQIWSEIDKKKREAEKMGSYVA